MANQVVMVTVTVTGTEITWEFDALEVELNAGDTLSWQFDGVPSDCAPAILFQSNTGFGPFQAFELKGNLITGRGNNGQTGTYSYQAQLLDTSGVRSTSTQTILVLNQVSESDTSPMVVIPCQSPTGTPEIGGPIDPLKLFQGDTVLWFVTGLSANFFVNILFPPSTGADAAVGPFKSLLFTRSLGGESTEVLGIIGLDFNPPTGAPDQFSYHIEIRDTSGKVVASDDPQIDNLGPPPQG